MRKNISSGAKWESLAGYSRAVRIGNIVEVSGTVAADGDNVVGKNDVYLQAKFILEKIGKVLKEADADLNNVIRTRIYVTDISKWQDVTKAHFETFKDIKPVTSMVEVKALISPEYLVEIEATAILENH